MSTALKQAESTETEGPDIEAIMSRIRADVRRGLASRGSQVQRRVPPAAKLFDGSVSPILYSDELNYLNGSWNQWAREDEFTSHRKLLGPIIVRLKRKLRSFIFESILKGYFEREREFQMQLVR